MEDYNDQIVAKPMVMWGVLIAALAAMQDNFKEAKSTLGINKTRIGIDFPYTEQVFPAIVTSLRNLEVQNSGFYSAELTEPRNQLLISRGEIGLKVYAQNHNHLMSIVDFITQCYLLNLFEKHQMAYPGYSKSYVAMGYSGGTINWTDFNVEPQTYTGARFESLYTTSTSLKFLAEHHISTELARVSAVDIEAVQMNFTV